MLVEEIIEYGMNWGRLAPCRTCIPKTGYFHDKTKISQGKIIDWSII